MISHLFNNDKSFFNNDKSFIYLMISHLFNDFNTTTALLPPNPKE